MIGRVPTGPAPTGTGIAIIDAGRQVLVSHSNRFGGSDDQSLRLLDASKIGHAAAAILGTVPARRLPREMRVSADGRTLFVVNTMSQALEVVDLERLPLLVH